MKEPEGMLEIVIDHREGRSPVWQALHARGDINCTVRELSCGDYLPHPTFAVERKAAGDFVLSIMDRRLFAQVLRLREEYENAAFIIEGDVYATRSGMQPAAIRGALSYLMTLGRVSVITVRDARETAELLADMARHLQEGLGYDIALRANKPKNLSDLAQYLLEGLPSVGPGGAKVLLKHFGSAKAVFNASVIELCHAPGIGKKTAERIREALDHAVN
jgi:fanconi anemia group M protein